MVYELFHLVLFNHRKKMCVFIFLVVRTLKQNFFMCLPLTKEVIRVRI